MAWLVGYKYRKAIAITGAAGCGTDYQVDVTVNSGTGDDAPGVAYLDGLASFFPNDLAFTDNDGTTELSYWRKDTNTFIVKVADSLESAATIYVYYGLATGYSKSDPTDLTNYRPTRYASNPVFSPTPSSWNGGWVQVHAMIDNTADDGLYYMFYSARDDSLTGIAFRIGLATSSDGDIFTDQGMVLSVKAATGYSASVGYPCVWAEGATWHMLFAGSDNTSNHGDIFYATSADKGYTWSVQNSDNPVITRGAGGAWNDLYLIPGHNMIKEGNTYYFYVTGVNAALGHYAGWKIGLYTSTDLTNWTPDAGNPLMDATGLNWAEGVLEPFVKKFGDTYYMWFQGNTAVPPDRTAHGIATSPDKTTWTVNTDVSPWQHNNQDSTGFDYQWTEAPIFIDFGTHWRIYHGGSNAGGAQSAPRFHTGYSRWEKYGNGANTFVFFDDFLSNALDTTTKWTNTGTFSIDRGMASKYAANTSTQYVLKTQTAFAYPLAIEARVKLGPDWADEYGWGLVIANDSAWATSGYLAGHFKDATNDYSRIYLFPGGTNNGTNESVAADTFYNFRLTIDGTTQKFFINSTQKGTLTSTPPQASQVAAFITARAAGTSAFTGLCDYFAVRKYNPTEPVVGTPGAVEQASGKALLDGFNSSLLKGCLVR